MPANVSPIWTLTPNVDGALVVTAAAVVYDISGTIGTDIYKIFTAGSNGSFVERVRCKYAGTSTTASNAAVLKLWISTVGTGTPTIGTQAWFYEELVLPTTGTLTTTAPNNTYDVPFGFRLENGQFLLAKITVSQPANFGWLVTTIGGDY